MHMPFSGHAKVCASLVSCPWLFAKAYWASPNRRSLDMCRQETSLPNHCRPKNLRCEEVSSSFLFKVMAKESWEVLCFLYFLAWGDWQFQRFSNYMFHRLRQVNLWITTAHLQHPGFLQRPHSPDSPTNECHSTLHRFWLNVLTVYTT